MDNLKQVILDRWGDRIHDGIVTEIFWNLGTVSESDIIAVVQEILHPPAPTAEELDIMKVSDLDSVVVKYNLTIDGYATMLKVDKLYAIKLALGYIENVEPLNTEENATGE